MSVVADAAIPAVIDPAICITLMVAMSIGISGTCRLRERDQMPPVFKWLYFSSWIAAVLFQITYLFLVVLAIFGLIGIAEFGIAVTCSGYFAHLLMMLCILCTAVLRLNMATKGSVFQISKCTLIIFSMLIVFVLNLAGIITVTMLIPMNREIAYSIQSIAFTIAYPLYIMGAISAMFLLSRNLLDLAKMQAANSGKYQRLVRATARYLICFLVAFSSSLILYGFNYFVYHIFRDWNAVLFDTTRCLLFMCDQCINFFCIFLQYAFGIKLYHLICCIPDRCCRRIIERKIEHHVLCTKLQLETVTSFSSPTSISQTQATVSVSAEDAELEAIRLHGNDRDMEEIS